MQDLRHRLGTVDETRPGPHEVAVGVDRPHLRTRNQLNRELLTQKVPELSAKGLSQRQISHELHIALGYVNKLMRNKI